MRVEIAAQAVRLPAGGIADALVVGDGGVGVRGAGEGGEGVECEV